ncbi:ABC transporter [Streptomyces sp. NPDC090994]|uniref:ABC transporter n=1 Tax=Streptomyces sp. NPDC090994 TaxID=3365969 RepID=UPI003813BBFA
MRVVNGVASELVRPVGRTVPWWALGAAGVVGLLLVAVARWTGGGEPSPHAALLALRGAALAGGLGLASLLDDPARHTTAAVPVPRPARQALRAALVAPLVALWWTAVLFLVPAEVRPPAGGITLEAGAVALLALAAAAAVVRLTDRTRPGRAVATALLVAAVVSPLFVPDSWAVFVQSGDPRWAESHDRWAVALAAAAAVWAASAREPVRRGWGRRRLPAGTRPGTGR